MASPSIRVAARGGDPRAPEAFLRTITCHLGSGASVAAVLGGRSVDTTMGFTPMEGLVMATGRARSTRAWCYGCSVHAGMTEPQLNDALEQKSGLLALAGVADMREVLRASARASSARGSRSTSTSTGCARASAEWPRQ